MTLIAKFGDKTVEYRQWSDYVVVYPDYDQDWGIEFAPNNYHVSRNTRNNMAYTAHSGESPIGLGAPATARFTPLKGASDIVLFGEKMQLWLHAINSKRSQQSEEVNKRSFASLFRDNVMMCDFGGTWSRADWINRTRLEAGDIQLKPMVCGGSVLKVIGQYSRYLLVEGMTNKNFHLFTPETHPHLFFAPVISVRQWIPNANNTEWIEKREWYAEPFDDYAEKTLLPVLGQMPASLFGLECETGYVSAIDKFRCYRIFKGEKVKNPFIMRFDREVQNPYENFVS